MVRRPFSFWVSHVILLILIFAFAHSYYRLDYINYVRNGPSTGWSAYAWVHQGKFFFIWHHNPRLYKIVFQENGLRLGMCDPATIFNEPIKLDPAIANVWMENGLSKFFTKNGELSSLDKNEAAIGLAIPMWLVMLVVTSLAIFQAWRFSRRRRLYGRPICRACGYDLRASRDRCPECGTAIPAASTEPVSS